MSCELRAIGKNGVAADLTVVSQMDISHDPIVIPQLGHAFITDGAYIESTKFTNDIAITNDQLTWLAFVFFILRDGTKGIELKNLIITTNGCMTVNDAMRSDLGTRSYLYMRPYHCEWTNGH